MIAIKGMEVPKNCSECKLCIEDKYADMTCALLCEDWEENDYNENHRDENCPLVEIVTCKDCKHWRDSDGEYRRGCGAESKCPINSKRVYEGNCYCAYAERKD